MNTEESEFDRIKASGRTKVVVDGLVSEGIEYWGTATLQGNGVYRCLANVGGALCVVEVAIRFGANGAQQ